MVIIVKDSDCLSSFLQKTGQAIKKKKSRVDSKWMK